MKNTSIWNDIKSGFNFSSLNEDINVDVLIIGGGMTGISTAYHLRESGLNVCVVVKNKLCCGVTSRTTGKLTYLQENIYSKLLKYHSLEKVKLYLESQIFAMNMVVDIIEKNKIDCNLEKVRSYVFSFDNDGKLEKEIDLLKDIGVSLNLTNVLPTGDDVMNAYYVGDTYVFHP